MTSACRFLLFVSVPGIVTVVGLAALFQADSPLLADDPPSDVAATERIVELIDDLGSSSFAVRESAEKELIKLGQVARAPLTAAKDHKSAEVRSRVARILKQFRVVPLRDSFLVLAKQSEEKLDLEEGMWLISRILNPDVDRDSLSQQLDKLADKVRQKLGRDEQPRDVAPDRMVKTLCEVLFVDEGFGGNFDDYLNPNNSSLEKVLETRKGLPILVSHVVVAVARRLDVPIVGVPTPGRYIVKYDGQKAPAGFDRQDIYLDPFHNGKILSREDREQAFPGIDPERMVSPGTKRDVLIRMLNNIESHLFDRDESDKAYLAVEFRVMLTEHADPQS